MGDITNIWIWLGFSIFLVIALGVDTFLLEERHVRSQQSMRAILIWTLGWVTLAFLFNGLLWIYLYYTADLAVANQKSLEFLTGYVIEKSLSVDNLFVFYIVFHHFRIPVHSQQRVLSYGIWGAIIMRLLVILLGVWIVKQFHWVLYLMGIVLLLTGLKIIFMKEKEKDLAETWIIKMMKRVMRITHEFHDNHFFVRKNALLYATPLFLALVFVEFSDLVFAMDSIPAIFAITRDPFIVWSSNIFAILGLRALYFLLAGMVSRLEFLKYGIALILIFVGFKMVSEPWLPISIGLSLGMIVSILVIFSVISVMCSKSEK